MIQYSFSNITTGLWEHVLERISSYVKGPKIGRNQPCSCGSGKKYKLCCLGKEEETSGRMNFNRYFLMNGELAFQPPKIDNYSQHQTQEITKHILKVERASQKIKTLPPEEIEQLPKERFSDCELLTLAE